MSRAGTIDGRQFARDRGVVSGTLELEDLPRLAELGCAAATLRFTVRGSKDPDERQCLTVEAAGQLQLVCQRCLGPLDVPVALSSELELAGTQEEIDAADDDIDRVLATKSMAVAQLVEDEAILALPMVPVHDRCEARNAPKEDVVTSPFATLATLRKSGAGPKGRRQ